MIRTELYYDFMEISQVDYSEKIKFYEKYNLLFEKNENFENLSSRNEFIRPIYILYQCAGSYSNSKNHKKAARIYDRIIQLIEQNHQKFNLDLIRESYYINSLFGKAIALYYLKKYAEAKKSLKIIQDTGFATFAQTNWYMHAKYVVLLNSFDLFILTLALFFLVLVDIIFSLNQHDKFIFSLIGFSLFIIGLLKPSNKISNLLVKIYRKKYNQNFKKKIDIITYYSQKIEKDPDDYVSLIERGIEYNIADDYEKSLADLNRALVINPTNMKALYYRAICLRKLNLSTQLIEDYTMLIELKYPDLAEIYNNRALTYGSLKQYELALPDHNKAIELEPYKASYLFNRATYYKNINLNKEAIKDYDLVLLYDPENFIAMTNRGEAHYALGSKEMAFADFTKAKESGYQEAIDNLNKLEF